MKQLECLTHHISFFLWDQVTTFQTSLNAMDYSLPGPQSLGLKALSFSRPMPPSSSALWSYASFSKPSMTTLHPNATAKLDFVPHLCTFITSYCHFPHCHSLCQSTSLFPLSNSHILEVGFVVFIPSVWPVLNEWIISEPMNDRDEIKTQVSLIPKPTASHHLSWNLPKSREFCTPPPNPLPPTSLLGPLESTAYRTHFLLEIHVSLADWNSICLVQYFYF